MDNTHVPIPIEEWKGMFTRGVDDATPEGYFLDSLNIKFNESSAHTRDGSERILDVMDIVRFSIYKRLGETSRFIYLNSSGQLFDSLFPTTPIWTDASFVDFSGANFNNRYYITPHNRVTGIPGKHLLVYDGSGAARLAGGAAPIGFTLTAVNSATSGDIEKGTHIIAVAFLTDSGFVSAPGPAIFAILNANGSHSANIGGLPIGPTGTIGRVLLSSKAIQDYNGNQLGYQLFFIPSANGGQIFNNFDTTATVSYFDAELQADATYLLDNRGLIPAGVCITEYNGRMCIAGVNGDEHSVYISKPFDPEQMSTTSGFLTVNPFDSQSGVTNLFSHRGNFIISKRNRLYQTMDNKDDPSTWTIPETVDEGTGTECFGVATILDHKSQQNNWGFLADRSGLIIYQGYVTRPEGSWLIQDTWRRINKNVFNKIQIVVDTETSSVYVSLPLDGSNVLTHILYGYYGEAWSAYGMDSMKIKWSLWTLPLGVVSITSDVDSVTGASVFQYSGTAGNIYKIGSDLSIHNDDNNAYPSYIKTALYTTKPKWTQHIALVGMRIGGNGVLHTSCHGQDNVDFKALRDKNLSLAPGRDIEVKANFQSTKIAIKIATGDSIDEYFKISRMDIYLKPMWQTTYDQTI
jgi:hypothetical protein